VSADGTGERKLITGSYRTGSWVLGGGEAWSRRGVLVFDPSGRLYAMRPDGTNRRRLGTLRGTLASWSPDGRSLVVALADGSHAHVVASAGNFPEWSPDGGSIVFARQGAVYVVRSDGGDLHQVGRRGGAPSWSPDGKWIVYSSDRSGDTDIWIVRADGTGERRVTHTPADDADPVWSASSAA
jgi:TolB protein